MAEWKDDGEGVIEESLAEEETISRWEGDMDDLMQDDWEQILGGPEDVEFEMQEALFASADAGACQGRPYLRLFKKAPETETREKDASGPPIEDDDIPF